MAEKVPSFKGGGAYWFVDLTTPDPLYILPILTGLTFLITVEVDVYFFKPYSVLLDYTLEDLKLALQASGLCRINLPWTYV